MQKIKAVFSMSLALLALIVTFAIPVSAYDKTNDKLLERGFPQGYIDIMAESEKLDIIDNPDIEFGDFSIQRIAINESNGINIQKIIPDSELIMVSAYYVNGRNQTLHMSSSLEWLKRPLINLNDVITSSWNNSDYTLVPGEYSTCSNPSPSTTVPIRCTSTLLGQQAGTIVSPIDLKPISSGGKSFPIQSASVNYILKYNKYVQNGNRFKPFQSTLNYAHNLSSANLTFTFKPGFGSGVIYYGNYDNVMTTFEIGGRGFN